MWVYQANSLVIPDDLFATKQFQSSDVRTGTGVLDHVSGRPALSYTFTCRRRQALIQTFKQLSSRGCKLALNRKSWWPRPTARVNAISSQLMLTGQGLVLAYQESIANILKQDHECPTKFEFAAALHF